MAHLNATLRLPSAVLYVVNEALPKTHFLTKIDMVIVATLTLIFLTALESLVVWVVDAADPAIAELIDIVFGVSVLAIYIGINLGAGDGAAPLPSFTSTVNPVAPPPSPPRLHLRHRQPCRPSPLPSPPCLPPSSCPPRPHSSVPNAAFRRLHACRPPQARVGHGTRL